MISNCEFCKIDFKQKREREPKRFCSCKCSAMARDKSTIRGTFAAGKAPWNKGLIGYLKGRKASDECREKISKSLRGSKAPNWRGGISTENELQRKQRRYYYWRKSVFERDNYTCVDCGARSKKGNRVELNADHIKPFAKFKELRFDLDNGRTLCVECHRKTPTYGVTGKKAELLNG
jgi:5-methylcytosine-specific restriction endonuclease McrA